MQKIARKVSKEKEKEIRIQRKRADFEGLLTLTDNKDNLKWDKKRKMLGNTSDIASIVLFWQELE
jgi:hypothetical protein